MQMCPFCDKVYDESEYSHCPYCSGELQEDTSPRHLLRFVLTAMALWNGMVAGSA